MLKLIAATILFSATIITAGFLLTPDKRELPTNIKYGQLNKEAKKQVECLADNIFFESAYEPKEGKVAVAFVTLNRLYTGKFGKDVCGVVKQKTQSVCQFSWYCEPTPNRLSYTKMLTDAQKRVYNEIVEIAVFVYLNYDNIKDPTKGALFYHADYVNPQWKNMIKTTVIGRHIFYIRKDFL